MADMLDLRSSSPTLDMSIPSNSILPLLASTNLNKAAASDDLPIEGEHIVFNFVLDSGESRIPDSHFLPKIVLKLHEMNEIWVLKLVGSRGAPPPKLSWIFH